MAQITQLSAAALPGKIGSFSPKVPPAPRVTGQITYLSALATPGRILTFIAKAEAPPPGQRSQMTQLSALATPGRVLTFTAKGSVRTKRVRGIGRIIGKVIG